eukprot:gene27313-biopygen17820
MPSQHPGSAS